MKKLIGVFLLGLPLLAAASNCDEIRDNIAEKIKNNGVDPSWFQLKLESADKPEQQIEGKIVGSCDRGHQKIVYIRLDGLATQSQTQLPANVEEDEPTQSNDDKTQPSIINPTESNQPADLTEPTEQDDFTVPQNTESAPLQVEEFEEPDEPVEN
ncbi:MULTISPECIES: DUF1161 domain-containing protein [unclassified Gilliamella]|uniref:DUF1161 domain-containing protein n=1 Tax=unclassified Gilliamella TaxID=2685620 RepID=UPI00080DF087|nr:DUF1161 domain-containing protein [Gilliamella apicola]OCG22995.1 hypothetical protein A9G23_02105 [Gilliamella apicola]OCG25362.1 hypothetical protein A9G22_00625 [Gilliamella apicola]